MSAKIYLYFFLFFSQLFLSVPVNSEVYKSIDENGNVIYSNKPISENAEKVKIKTEPIDRSSSSNQYKKQKKLLDVMQEERNEKIALEQKQKEEQEKRDEKCDKMKKHLNKMKDASMLYKETDDPKNPRIYTDEERKAAETKLENLIKEEC